MFICIEFFLVFILIAGVVVSFVLVSFYYILWIYLTVWSSWLAKLNPTCFCTYLRASLPLYIPRVVFVVALYVHFDFQLFCFDNNSVCCFNRIAKHLLELCALLFWTELIALKAVNHEKLRVAVYAFQFSWSR